MIIKKLTVAGGKYLSQDGVEKTRWIDIGHLHDKDGKQYITLYGHISLAALIKEGDTRVFVNLFSADKPKAEGAKPKSPGKSWGPSDEDVPF